MKPTSLALIDSCHLEDVLALKNRYIVILIISYKMDTEEFLEYITDEDENMLFSSSESSSTDTSEDEHVHFKVSDFINIIKSFSARDFKRHLRLTRSTALKLIELYQEHVSLPEERSKIGRPKLTPEDNVYIYLWYISNTETFRQLGNLFGIAASTAWNVIGRVSSFLVSIGPRFIIWPRGENVEKVSQKFQEMRGIRNVLGAIDGTHIKIKAPKNNPQDYFNRKQYYSVGLQVICDSYKKFIYVYCGEPGSLHDSRMFRRSDLYAKCEERWTDLFPPNTFLLGDSAYPLKEWLIPPYKDNGALSQPQRNFNYIHSATRIVVENSIGLLKNRFRRLLHFTEQTNLNLVVNIIYSACVLHNMCITYDDDFAETFNDEVVLDRYPLVEPGEELILNRREKLLQELLENNVI